MEKIQFRVEISRVIDVLSKEIYDSPYALLRENVQNAYDAILMRAQHSSGSWSAEKDGMIRVHVDNEKIVVSDNGIGMTESVLKDNYWTAGSSGKKTELAAKSGVIGTFGIGGMANFGVCKRLRIETESIESKERIVSEVEREKLSLVEDCITIEKIAPTGEFGTTVTATLDPKIHITAEAAQSYLSTYIQYLPVKAEINGSISSQATIGRAYRDDSASIQKKFGGFEFDGAKANVLVQCNDTGRVSCTLDNIQIGGGPVKGTICIRQDAGNLWGFRSYFGLAPIPISSHYMFGGVANVSILSPTAGREALTRESIEVMQKLINLAEECSTRTLASTDICNKSTPFMHHILATNRVSLAEKLKIRMEPERDMTLAELREYSKNNKCYFYDGNDEAIIRTYGSPETPLVVVSRSNPRRQLENLFIQQFCKMERVPDVPSILHVYDETEYEMSEIAFVIKVKNILEDDYALGNVDIKLAELSHNLPQIVKPPEAGVIKIFIQKGHRAIQPILACYSDSYDVFPGLIKDYLRNYIYQLIRNWVPSSTKEGAEALQKILRQKKELYEIKAEDVGLTSVFADFMAGKINFGDVVRTANTLKRTQTQEITAGNIGSMEFEIPGLSSSPVYLPKDDSLAEFKPRPSIIRKDIDTQKKLLYAEKKVPSLNNFQTFFAISDRAFREESDFFASPHMTRIIWGGHRIIFIFTHPSGRFSLYYDVEVFEDTGKIAGGGVFPTTTIITKRRIFIPVPENLKRYFELVEGKRKFYVRFDTIP